MTMAQHINRCVSVLLCVCCIGSFSAARAGKIPDRGRVHVGYVRPMVGTQGEGNTYPGASAPFGMVQFSPDTEKELWETA